MKNDRRPTVFYDRDCGWCRWSLGWLLRLDRRERLRPVPLQDPEAARRLPEMSEDERMASWHLVEPDGAVSSAGSAVPPLVEVLSPSPSVGVRAGRILGPPARFLYPRIAGNRSRLGKLVPSRAKARADRLIAERLDATPPD